MTQLIFAEEQLSFGRCRPMIGVGGDGIWAAVIRYRGEGRHVDDFGCIVPQYDDRKASMAQLIFAQENQPFADAGP
jgi:hypothetical protein